MCLPLCTQHAYADPWMDADYFQARVVIPPNASPTLLAAAEDFTRYWQISTGEQIEYGTKQEGSALIWLGRDVMPESLVSPGELASLGDQGFVIRTHSPSRRDNLYFVGAHMVIAGNTDEATRHGVLEYFHRYLNVRWYGPGETQGAFVENAGVPEVNLSYRTPFRFREVGYFGLWPKEKGIKEYREALHLPAAFQEGAGAEAELPASDTTLDLADADTPARIAEWIAAPGDFPAAAKLQLWTEESGRPVSAWHLNQLPPLAVSLRSTLEGGPAGAAQAANLAQAIQQQLVKSNPDDPTHTLLSLPSSCALPPDDLKLNERVIVQLSNAACDFSRPILLGHTESNRAFLSALASWSKTGATIFVRDHVASTRNNIAPFPNINVLRANLYAYTQHNVQGVYAVAWDIPEAKQAELDRLRAYLVSSLLWNPEHVVEDLVSGFLSRHYAAAAPHVGDYLAAFQESVHASGKPLLAAGLPEWLLPEYVVKAETALSAALKTELEPKFKNRVNALVPSLEYAQLLCPPALETQADGTKVWRRPKSRTLEQVLERMQSRGLVEPGNRINLLESIKADCGGETPLREQPYMEGQPPK